MTARVTALVMSPLDEAQLLDHFWSVKSDHAVDRMQCLREFSVIGVHRPEGWDPHAIREACRNHLSTADQCFTCYTGDRRLYWHHIIEIHHGGSNQPCNRVALCFRCHQLLHPWLQAPNRDLAKRAGQWTPMHTLVDAFLEMVKDGARMVA